MFSNERPSKSQLKRESTALQKLGEKLVELSDTDLNQLSLDSSLHEAIVVARGLTDHGAKRRQLQYIGKLMREIDAKPIEEIIQKMQLKSKQSNAKFRLIENWRDQLIEKGDEKLQELLTQYPDVDRQHLRQLVRQAQQQKVGAAKELFRFLRQVME
jgi:ribosome-associated protein